MKKQAEKKKKVGSAPSGAAASGPLDVDRMLLAVRAVVAHFNQKLASGSDLLGSDESMLVMLSLHRIPDALSPFPFAVPLAHPLLDAPKICLFGAGDGADLKAAVAKAGLKDLKVIGINKLRRKYKPYEMRRKLAGSHDLFLCDSQIQPQLLSVLGKSFFHKSKFPLGVDVSGDVAKQIAEARTSTLLRQSAGTTWVVKIGGTGWDARKLAENAITAANNAVAKCVTGKWENIRAIHVKSDTSIALPVFEQLAPVGFQLEGATAPVVSKKRADVRKADDDDENRELLELAREAELDIDEDFRFDVDDGDLEENDIEVRSESVVTAPKQRSAKKQKKSSDAPPAKLPEKKKKQQQQLIERGPGKTKKKRVNQ